ncbi:hypothetical protein AU14_02165 [Marinobacter similis]|uniref:Uncharacterized protein n=1 Tax=Marinobacter similis TaxID=1420916 RepID=W5YM45_9GAMM|nr:hypothetical protein AU14_02165 [Marinobacter similis]
MDNTLPKYQLLEDQIEQAIVLVGGVAANAYPLSERCANSTAAQKLPFSMRYSVSKPKG